MSLSPEPALAAWIAAFGRERGAAGPRAPAHPRPAVQPMPVRLLMNMYTTGSAHQPFNTSDIKARPAGGGDPQCNTQADVEAAPTAAGIAAAGADPPLSALGGTPGARPGVGVRGEAQGWV